MTDAMGFNSGAKHRRVPNSYSRAPIIASTWLLSNTNESIVAVQSQQASRSW